MSGNNESTILLSGATSTTAGIALLPNTSGDSLLAILSTALVLSGVAALGSFILMKVARKRLK